MVNSFGTNKRIFGFVKDWFQISPVLPNNVTYSMSFCGLTAESIVFENGFKPFPIMSRSGSCDLIAE